MPVSSSYILFQLALSLGVMAFYGWLFWSFVKAQVRCADAVEEIAKSLKASSEGKQIGQKQGGLFD